MSTVWCRVCGVVVSKFLAVVSSFLYHLFFGTHDDWQTSRPSWFLFLTGTPWFAGTVWQTFWVSAVVDQCLISSLYKFRESSWMGLWSSSVGKIKAAQDAIDFPTPLLKRSIGVQSLKWQTRCPDSAPHRSFQASHQKLVFACLADVLGEGIRSCLQSPLPGTWLTISSYSKGRLFNSAFSQLSSPFSGVAAMPAFAREEGRTHTVYFWIGFWGLRSATCSGCSFPYSLRISHVTHLA